MAPLSYLFKNYLLQNFTKIVWALVLVVAMAAVQSLAQNLGAEARNSGSRSEPVR